MTTHHIKKTTTKSTRGVTPISPESRMAEDSRDQGIPGPLIERVCEREIKSYFGQGPPPSMLRH